MVLVDLIRAQVDAHVARFPELYRKSWRLTRIVAVYLVGQILRTDDELLGLLDNPAKALKKQSKLVTTLKEPVLVAAGTLKQRHDQHVRNKQTDAFNVDFKRQDILHDLRDRARDNFALMNTVGAP